MRYAFIPSYVSLLYFNPSALKSEYTQACTFEALSEKCLLLYQFELYDLLLVSDFLYASFR